MKDSYNYSGFASAMFASSKSNKSNGKRSIIIEGDDADSNEDDLSRHYPPYLLQDAVAKPQVKK